MMEIRPITANESSSFLKVLCDVFNLDFKRAEMLYYKDPFYNLDRKWALLIDNQIQSILTTVPLEFGDGPAIGIAGVATAKNIQGKGLASILIKEVLMQSKLKGEDRALLFAQNPKLYQKAGFVILDEVIRGKVQVNRSIKKTKRISFGETQDSYAQWAAESPHRLHRNNQRWEYWNFFDKPCYDWGQGYVCLEDLIIREAVFVPKSDSWPVPTDSQWIGLWSLTQELQIPLTKIYRHALFMGVGFKHTPSMFMVDQF
jgi:GNAT superfamily N-acetyltransferase